MDIEKQYIKHDLDAGKDEEILALRAEYGSEGYGWYWLIIEYLRTQSTYSAKLRPAVIAKGISDETNIPKLKQFLDDCINEYRLFKTDGVFFWSERLNRDISKIDKTSKTNSENRKKGWEKQREEKARIEREKQKKDTLFNPLNIGKEYERYTSVEQSYNDPNTTNKQINKQSNKRNTSNDVKEKKSSDFVSAEEEKVFIEFPLLTGEVHKITDKEVQGYKKLFPELDIEQELRSMLSWLLDPKNDKKKSEQGSKSFITKWLRNDQAQLHALRFINGAKQNQKPNHHFSNEQWENEKAGEF